MTGPGPITSWPRVTPEPPSRPSRPETARSTDPRRMLAELFGARPADPQPAARTPVTTPVQDDEFAPHLGRYLDVTA